MSSSTLSWSLYLLCLISWWFINFIYLQLCFIDVFWGTIVSGAVPFLMKRSMSFSGIDNNKCEEVVHGDDELSDDGSQLGEKKKRLSLEQVKALEKSFEIGNKLEPERKMHLAKALGLQPRQIAIWFQNRRARWKTKQLEKDYEVLKKQFEALKADNDNLQTQNKKLTAEVIVSIPTGPNGFSLASLFIYLVLDMEREINLEIYGLGMFNFCKYISFWVLKRIKLGSLWSWHV